MRIRTAPMRHIRRSLFLFLLVLTISKDARALDPDKAITQYVHTVWKTEQGLPQRRVNDIIQTRDGYLWFTSHLSLVRFDGFRFTSFEQRDIPQFNARNLPVLAEDHDGNLWIATEGAGVARYKNGTFQSFTTRDGLSDNSVLSLAVDRDGSLWIGTQWGGLNHFQNGKIRVYRAGDGIPGDRVNILYVDEQGNLWIGGEGLSRFRNGTFTKYTTADGLSHRIVSAITSDKKGSIWVGTWGGGVNRFQDGKFTVYTTKEGLSHNEIRDINCDKDGNIWVATREGGLARYRNGRWDTYSQAQGLSDTGVRAVYEDREGDLWIGTYNGGLNRFKDGDFVTYSAEEGLISDDVWAIYGDHHKNLWAGTSHGIVRFSNGTFTAYGDRDGLSTTNVVSLYGDSTDSIWVGTRGGGLFVFRNGGFTSIPLEAENKLRFINSVYVDRSDTVWVGTPEGLIRIQNGVQSRYTTRNGLIHNNVSVMTQDRSGNMWIGTRGGLTRLKENKFTSYPTKTGVTYIFEDAEGVLWFGTIGGIHRLQAQQFTTYTSHNGLFADTANAITEDSAGNLWFSSGYGIFRVNKKEFVNFDRKIIPWLTSVAYGMADGLKDIDCNSGPPGVWKDESGKLWFSTVKGIAVIKPSIISRKLDPPHVVIEEFYADKKFYNPATKIIELPPGRSRLEFVYTGLNLVAPERVRFQYSLEGYDQHWIDSATQRSATYTNIRPGRYSFRVEARNEDGFWNKEEGVLVLNLKPYFYQTSWFYLLCSAMLAVGGGGLYRLRLRSVRREFRAVILERSRIAREIHDGLAQALAGVVLQLETAQLLPSQETAQQHFERALELARKGVQEARRTIGDLRTGALPAAEFPEAIRSRMQRQLQNSNLAVHFDVTGDPLSICESVQLEFLRICEESLQNVLKHSRARNVHVKMEYKNGLVRLSIQDDGKGFDVNSLSPQGHFGLIGIRERAAQIGAEVSIQSAPGQGTTVQISVPRSS